MKKTKRRRLHFSPKGRVRDRKEGTSVKFVGTILRRPSLPENTERVLVALMHEQAIDASRLADDTADPRGRAAAKFFGSKLCRGLCFALGIEPGAIRYEMGRILKGEPE